MMTFDRSPAARAAGGDPPTERRPTRGSGVAIWRQIAEALRGDLEAGRYRPRDQLPPENDLAARFGVNRHTLRRAVLALVDEGRLIVEQGRGTFVATPVIDYPVGQRTRLSANLRAQGRETSRRVIRSAMLPAPASAAEALGIALGTPLYQVETVSDVDGQPFSLSLHHFVLERVSELPKVWTPGLSVTAALERAGVRDYLRAWTRLTARLPTVHEATLLAQARNRPIMQSEAVDTAADGTPIQHLLTVFAGDRVQFVVGKSTAP
jgi:GntR family phosphonate transport system transcriptional regulator